VTRDARRRATALAGELPVRGGRARRARAPLNLGVVLDQRDLELGVVRLELVARRFVRGKRRAVRVVELGARARRLDLQCRELTTGVDVGDACVAELRAGSSG
jgi:hypothetical protein